ncbi:MAG: TonB-dependent receptor [Steroidobacteraceae bacterium]
MGGQYEPLRCHAFWEGFRSPLTRPASAVGLALLFAAATAGAQTAATNAGATADALQLEEVTVTGSRIRGAAPVGSDVAAISSEDIEAAGRANGTDLLRLVPQVSNLGADDSRTNGPQRAQANIFSASAINLRGVGPEATLVLLDGRRPGRSESGRFFDTSTIPSIALQRIEVVADGASAVYGSDAVAGVVNLVPYHNFDGVKARTSYGFADGMKQYNVSLLAGLDLGRGSVLMAVEHYHRDNLSATKRSDLYDDSRNTAGGIGTSTNAAPGNISVGGVLRPARDTNGDGRLSMAEYAAAAGQAPNRLSNWTGVDALPEQERNTVFAYGEFDATDNLKLYAEGHISRRSFSRLSSSPTATLTVPATNYYNQTGLPLTVNYSFMNDVGSAGSDGYENPRQITLGTKYQMRHDWQTEAYVTSSEARSYRTNNNVVNTTALSGSGVLSDATPAALNPFGGANQAATLAKFMGYSTNDLTYSMRNAALKFDGPLFGLPGGDVRMAAGVEYIREVRESTNTNTSQGTTVDTLVVANYPTVTRKVKSAFAELLVPIVGTENQVPGIRRLALSIAGRSDSYDDSLPGTNLLDTSTFNPKFGLTWDVLSSLSFRASYGKSFRAPSLGDYSLGPPTTSVAGAQSGMSHAAGLPLPAGTVNGVSIQGGRVDGALSPERARTLSFGVDYTPFGADRWKLSLTYYNLVYKNQIVSAVSGAALNDAAYATALANAGLLVFNPTTAQVQSYLDYGGFPYVSVIGPRNVYGTGSGPSPGRTIPVAVLMDMRSVNTGQVDTNGVDFTLRGSWDSRWGTWRLSNSATYVASYKQSLFTGTEQTEYVNTYGFPVRFRTRTQLGFDRGPVSANLFLDYINSYKNTQVSPVASVSSFTTLDVNLGYRFSKFSVQLNTQNVFDRNPPYALVSNPAQLYDNQNAGAIGRLISVALEARF